MEPENRELTKKGAMKIGLQGKEVPWKEQTLIKMSSKNANL